MIKRLFLFLTLCLMASHAYSEEAAKFTDRLKSLKTLSADIHQTNTVKGFGDDVFKGKLYVVYGEKSLWTYHTPYEQYYYFSDKQVTYYDSLLNQVIIADVDALKQKDLYSLLYDIDNIYSTFDVLDKGSVIMLTPKEDLGYRQITINMRDDVITGIYAEDNTGNKIRIEFSNINTGMPINENSFAVTYPEDAEVFRY